jgi:site-specific DNA-methyltransferase (adenine-specific)
MSHLIYGDNLNVLRHMESETIDLIYLDPPYNSKRDYNVTFGSVAQSKAFEDTWKWDSTDDIHLRELADINPGLSSLLLALGGILSKRGLYPYLVNMAVRLVEMHRLLKPTGSLYLHVDPTASHYLKLVMDQIFGGGNFRNEIIWCYKYGSRTKSAFGKKHDVLLRYSKSNDFVFNGDDKAVRVPHEPESLKLNFRKTDEDGRLYREGRWSNGKVYRYYADEGRIRDDVITDIGSLHQADAERLGYPTQKPLALLELIIQASSNEGDVVLDPYMGSGTTIEAAAKHGRKWIGIDVTHHAVATTISRLEECGLEIGKDQIVGVPEDLASARQLKDDSPRQFDAWCVLQCHAMPQDDGERIVGIRQFPSISKGKEHLRRALYMATHDDPPTMEDVKDCVAKMRKQGCEIGFLYCFEMPEDPAVLHFLQNQGQFKDDLRAIPTVQLITMRDMLHGNSAANLTSEWRQRRLRDLSNQLELV